MNQRLGMDPGTAIIKRDAMQLQVNALSAIAADLLTTHSAAQNPQFYGIDAGERTVAPWSIHTISSARSAITGASAAASTLLTRLSSEAQAQQDASGDNAWEAIRGPYGVLREVSWWRRWVSWPRTLLELPAAIRMLRMQGAPAWGTGLLLRNWWLSGSSAGGEALRTFTMNRQTPYWIRSLYVAGNNLKIQNLVDPRYWPTPMLGRRVRLPAWSNALHIKDLSLVSKIGTTMTAVGKGFAVLGAIGGAVNLATGINGMMDGDVSSDDAWAVADGAVGLITSIGSLAPPPVGLVFAGAGLAYSAGRWLFGEDENGKTGLDHIGNAASNTVEFLGDATENVGDFVEDLWPW